MIIIESALIAFVCSALLIPLVIRSCKKHGWYDSTNERKIHKGNIPRLGAVGFIPASIIGCVFFCLTYPEARPLEYIPLAISAFIIFFFGVLDDFIEMRAKKKLAVQIIATLLILLSGKTFKTIGSIAIPAPVSYGLTFLWIAGMINAFNLIDGVDGLCGGLSAIILSTLGIIYLHTSPTMAAFCFVIASGIAGFLLYNKPKAKIFMGDGGSQTLGFLIAALPLYNSASGFETNKAFSMVLLTCIPVIDTVAAMIRRAREHRSFFSPDKAHLHHKLMNVGLNSVQILLLLLSIQAVLCAVVASSLLLDKTKAVVLICSVWFIVLGAFIMLHYYNRKILQKQKEVEDGADYASLNIAMAQGASVARVASMITPPRTSQNLTKVFSIIRKGSLLGYSLSGKPFLYHRKKNYAERILPSLIFMT